MTQLINRGHNHTNLQTSSYSLCKSSLSELQPLAQQYNKQLQTWVPVFHTVSMQHHPTDASVSVPTTNIHTFFHQCKTPTTHFKWSALSGWATPLPQLTTMFKSHCVRKCIFCRDSWIHLVLHLIYFGAWAEHLSRTNHFNCIQDINNPSIKIIDKWNVIQLYMSLCWLSATKHSNSYILRYMSR